jgi:hypothetical protein
VSTDIESGDWSALDSWWDAYIRTRSVARPASEARLLERNRFAHSWRHLESWWQLHADSAVAHDHPVAQVVEPDRLRDDWNALDSWWRTYTETGDETAVKLAALLDRASAEWGHSDAPFDADPLAADLTRERFLRGPLQPSVELEWSRWLAQVLRPAGALVAELFDTPSTQPPSEVIREDRLAKPSGGFRRPDILVCHPDRSVSIEVKLDDENFGKTAETAALIERHYDDHEWTHVLLLPKEQRQRLTSIVDPPLVDGTIGRFQLVWEESGPVEVLYWRDVSAAIRSVLRRGADADPHWAANAYLLCAVIEQQLIGFQPQSVVERMADPAGIVDRIHPIRVADALEEQLSYLHERVET